MSGMKIVDSKMAQVPIPESDMYSDIRKKMEENIDKPALIDLHDARELSFREVIRQSDLVARHLMSHGFVKGNVLAIFSSNSLEYGIMVLAALRLGGKFANMNHLLTANDLRRLIDLCDADFLYAGSDVMDKAIAGSQDTRLKKVFSEEERDGCVCFASMMEEPAELPSLPPWESLNINPVTDVVCILFSSGTTGMPKAVMISHRSLLVSYYILGCGPARLLRDFNLIFVPLSHIFGVGLMLLGLGFGRCNLIMRRFDPAAYLSSIQKYKLEIIQIVPSIAVMLAKHPIVEKYDLTSVTGVVSTAAPLSAETEHEICKRLKGSDIKIFQMYGMTEAAGACTGSFTDDSLKPADFPPVPPGTCGILLPGWKAKVVDTQSGEDLDVDQDGELLFKGPQTMLGYQKNPEATASTIDQDKWLHSGDIGHYDKDGYFFIVDRLKELIKFKGYQVPPAELEALILTHPSVADCGVVGIPDEEAGELPHAWVVRKEDVEVTEKDIVDFVGKQVAPFKKLRGGVKFVQTIPKSANGKILRREIKTAMSQ